ncbi:MAG: gliding motility-associated C-terminal domain-containing protein, partial [Bacteroidetes bacterium]|nr:gliding motility-associated C-terminal domain-containing protein [Bacteroidota bacterium]
AAGTYGYTVTDANSCQQTGSVTVGEPAAAFTVSETHVDVACYGNNTGTITLTGAGGTSPYGTAWWSDGATGDVRNNLLAGTYNYTDSDHNGCLVTGSVTITQPATGGMTITMTETDATCSSGNTGSATATVSGGVSPYGFSWSGGYTQNDPLTSTDNNLAPATYAVTVTDANGCTALGSTTVNAPAAITAQMSVTNVNCYNGTDGAISITSGGGTGAISYTWSSNAGSPGNSAVATSLAAGTYQVTLTDANGCELDTFASVAQPSSALTFATPVFVKNVSCNGGSDGEIQYTVSGGTGSYTYIWSGSAAGSGNDATGLAANSYDVTITDGNGCSVTDAQTVTEPAAVTITAQSQTNVTCSGNTDGTATLTAAGGTPGGVYTYSWTPSVSSDSTATGLAAGTYTVVVSDNNSCTVQTTFNITAPPAITAQLSSVNELCNGGNNGSITVSAGGGSPASGGYVYTWTPNVSTTDTATGLAAGSYTVVVTDSLGCSVSRSAIITEPAALTLTAASVVSVSCSRDSNGQVTFAVSGGTPGYQYAISPDGVTFSAPNGTGTFSDLKIGTYTGQVTDANGCTTTATATITAPDSVTVTINIDTVKCYGESNGGLIVTSAGGTPGYTYDFSGGVSNTTGLDQNLIAGTYGVTVTDSRGCAQTYQVVVPQPDSLHITITPDHPIVTLGETTVIQAISNSPYEVMYTWSPADGLSNTNASNVTVTTNNDVVYTVTAYINPHGEHCSVVLQVPVTVVSIYNVFVPNVFTPNGDGKNDFFEIYGDKKTFKFVEVSVYDRWGERVFFSNDVNFQWDGTFKSAQLEPGTFVYNVTVEFIDGHVQPAKGSLLLLR